MDGCACEECGGWKEWALIIASVAAYTAAVFAVGFVAGAALL